MPAAPIDPTGGLLSYGVLGILVVLLVSGLLVPGYLWKRTDAENARLRALIDDKVYPLVDRAIRVVEDCVELLKALADVIRDLRQYADDLRELPTLIREVRELRDDLRRRGGGGS